MVDAGSVALGVFALVLATVVAAVFARGWRRTQDPLHLLVALSFVLLGVSFLVTTGLLDSLLSPGAALAARVAGQVAGGLLLLFGYTSVRRYGSARIGLAFVWTALTGMALVTIVYISSRAEGHFPSVGSVDLVGSLVLSASFALCGVMSFSGFIRHPMLERGLVPAAFLAFALENYTWLFLGTTHPSIALLPHLWRLTGLSLLLAAVWTPSRHRGPSGAAA